MAPHYNANAAMRVPKAITSESGQALVETAVVLPFLLILVFNAINFGYFFIVSVNLASASRSGATYSILGSSTPAGDIWGLPPASSGTRPTVADLTYDDLYRSLPSSVNASVQICSATALIGVSGVNGTGANVRTNCATCTNRSTCLTPVALTTGTLAPPPDPRSPNFLLNYVVVTYSFNTLIPGPAFNLALLPVSLCNSSGSCSFRRRVAMRAMD
jgi:Flp pilus assembly protein TadG